MGEWHDLVQSILFGIVFAFLIAKLISAVISFREENLRHVHEEGPTLRPNEPEAEPLNAENATEPETRIAEKTVGSTIHLDDDDDDDDWEGVESTELDEAFSAATAFVAASAADRLSQKVPNDVQLQLYGLYKIATEGPCSVPQPSAIKISARAKWNAWQRLGVMPPEEAMQKYVMIVTELYPSWASGSTIKNRGGYNDERSSTAKGTMGPVFSTFVNEEGSDNELKLDSIHVSARDGEMDKLLQCVEIGASVNLRDSEGRTALHWAVDRGHLNVVEFLVSRKADVNAQDNEGQTPLHYAALCEREAIAELLVNQNGDLNVKDNDGKSPRDLCVSDWIWMHANS